MKKTIETVSLLVTALTVAWTVAYAVGTLLFHTSTKDFEIDLSGIGEDADLML